MAQRGDVGSDVGSGGRTKLNKRVPINADLNVSSPQREKKGTVREITKGSQIKREKKCVKKIMETAQNKERCKEKICQTLSVHGLYRKHKTFLKFSP